ncbi:MAG: hypothetical protein ACUVS2_13885 [Candidatus Flexifilum sp.]|jgi:hypothetical protein
MNEHEYTARIRPTPPDHTGIMIAAFIMLIGGWGGLYWLVNAQLPRVGPLWAFFALLYIAVVGTALPFVRALNTSLTPLTRRYPPGGVLVRQAVWIGLFVVACAWLQIPRALNAPIAFFLALALIVIEGFLRSREIPHERLTGSTSL